MHWAQKDAFCIISSFNNCTINYFFRVLEIRFVHFKLLLIYKVSHKTFHDPRKFFFVDKFIRAEINYVWE